MTVWLHDWINTALNGARGTDFHVSIFIQGSILKHLHCLNVKGGKNTLIYLCSTSTSVNIQNVYTQIKSWI